MSILHVEKKNEYEEKHSPGADPAGGAPGARPP
jgi:hypothetical protein